MKRKLLYLILIANIVSALAVSALLWIPQLSDEGYVRMNKTTGAVVTGKGNTVQEFVSQYVGEEIVEKERMWTLVDPILPGETPKAFAQNVEVKVDGQPFTCAPKGPTPPAPQPPPTPIPPPPMPSKSSWGISYTKIPEAMQTASGEGITVCVMDTGVANHPALNGVVIEKLSMYGDDGGDRFGHGTHVIGTVAGPNGIGASRAKIISMKVLSDSGSGSTQAILNGAQKCVQRGAKIISASLGSDEPSPMFQQMVQWVTSQGVWFVMAGGNNGSNRFGFPAAYAAGVPRAIAVIATTQQGTRARFSQHQPGFPLANVIAAPGENIFSLLPPGGCQLCNGNGSGEGLMSGTSMATPLVSGVVAILLSIQKNQLLGNPSLDPTAGVIVDALKSVRGG